MPGFDGAEAAPPGWSGAGTPTRRVPREESYWAEHRDDLELILAVSAYLGVTLAPAELTLPDGVRVGVHGMTSPDHDAQATILAQCAPHRGEIKSTHRNQVLASALRLVWLRTMYYPQARTFMVFSNAMARLIAPGAWIPVALRDLHVDVLVVTADGVRPGLLPPTA